MTSNSEDSEWQKLSWAEKVRICQQGIAQEDSLLIAYVVIFIAIEAMFFAIMFSSNIVMPCWLSKTIPALGILLAINFALVCKSRGDAVDRWGAILYTRWKELPGDQELNVGENLPEVKGKALIKAEAIARDYEGCVKRLSGGWKGWKAMICGWPPCCKRLKFWLKSARRLVTIFTPILVIMLWIFILVTN